MEEVVEVRRGRKKVNRAQVLPRLCAGEDGDDRRTWHLVKNTPKVTGFLGGKGKPSPISDCGSRAHPEAGAGRYRAARSPRSSTKSASRCGSAMARSPPSMAWSKKSTKRRRASKWRSRSSDARRRSNWNTGRSRRSDLVDRRALRPRTTEKRGATVFAASAAGGQPRAETA